MDRSSQVLFLEHARSRLPQRIQWAEELAELLNIGIDSAYRRIRGAILDELRAADRISRASRAQVRKIEQTIRQWYQDHGATPGEEELAAAVGMTTEALTGLLDRAQPWLSLDEMVLEGENKNVLLKELIADARAVKPDELPGMIDQLKKEMFDLAEKLEFEKAAALRDRIHALEALQLDLG